MFNSYKVNAVKYKPIQFWGANNGRENRNYID